MARRILRADEYQKPDAIVRRVAHKHEAQIEAAVAAAFDDFRRDDDNRGDDDAIAAAILGGGAAGLIAALGFARLGDNLRARLTVLDGPFRDAAADAASADGIPAAGAANSGGVVLAPGDDGTPAFIDLDAYRDRLADDIVAAAEQSVGDAVERGRRARMPIDVLSRSIRETIGLTDRQAFSVFNFRRALEEGDASLDRALDGDAWKLRDRRFDPTVARAARGEPVDADAIDRMVDAYAKRQIAYRARMIAQTETTRAANAGVRANWVSYIADTGANVRRFWRVALDERTCVICYSVPVLNPNGVGILEPFLSIAGPMFDVGVHPWCNCSLDYDVVDAAAEAAAAD